MRLQSWQHGTSKAIGDRSTLAVMAAFQRAGYGLYIPFGENTRCDLIVDRDGDLIRVQCKTGRMRTGAVRFAVCSTYGHHRNPLTCNRGYDGQIDYFAVYCPETAGVYLVPIEDVPLKRVAALRVEPSRNNQYQRVRQAADYEIGRVTTEGLRGPSGA
jgi:PD-(D/E)XK endonuclease